MAKSIWKPEYVNLGFIKTLSHYQTSPQKNRAILMWSKASIITPGMVGLAVEVHDGQRHVPVYVTDSKIGYKFGQFVSTRTFRSHIKKDKRSKRR